jgi:hypothetical protein
MTLEKLTEKIINEQDTKTKEGKSKRETQEWINARQEDVYNILKYNRANDDIFPLDPQARKAILDDENVIDNIEEMESPIKLLETIQEAVNAKDRDRLEKIIDEYETVFGSYKELIKDNHLGISLNF